MLLTTPLTSHFALLLTVLTPLAQATSPYAPLTTTCPSTPLTRLATSLSASELSYLTSRKSLADISLAAWLKKTNPAFDVSGDLPTLGLSISGGGYRAFLTGAGIIQALDGNDGDVSTSGLYQAVSYVSALSGGSWLVSSLADHGFPTVSSLMASQWSGAFKNSLLAPDGIWTLISYAKILIDIHDKEDAGFQTSFTDLWSRLLGYQMLAGSNGGVASTLSGIQNKSAFAAHQVPYPIITTLAADLASGSCTPGVNASIWEMTPFETGSWAPNVNAFTPSKYLGTAVTNGKATTCKAGFDNLGFVLGTSSNIFNDIAYAVASLAEPLNALCGTAAGLDLDTDLANAITSLETVFPSITENLEDAVDAFYALYPNPFYKLTSAPEVSSQATLRMVDGGESGQTSPIFPHLLPTRNVSLVIVNDNNGDGATIPSYPNGTAIYNTYLAARAAGLKRMPVVPAPAAYLANYTSGEPIFFGCKNDSVVTLVWVPNKKISYESGIDTFTIQMDPAMTEGMVANGKAIMSRSDSDEWGVCLGCAILDAGKMNVPSTCEACFKRYCYAG